MALTWPWENTSCDYVIYGDSVYVENDICYMIATPHTIDKSGWVQFDFLTKKYSGDIQVVGGFVNDKVELTKFEVFDGVEWVSRHYQKQKEKYNHAEMADWQNCEVATVKKNTWYSVRVWVEIPFNQSGKYTLGIMPSGMTVEEAEASGDLYLIDPWYNNSWQYRKQITVNNGGAALTNYQCAWDVNYGAGADANYSVYCSNHCQTDFEDIRFTKSDGTTLLDIWREEYTDSGDTTFWVELDSLPAGNSTFYIYYGNATAAYPYLASNTAHGEATFIAFDDFERGSNTDPIGGDWTISSGDSDISTTHDIGDVAGYYGTRAGEILGNAGPTIITYPAAASDSFAIRFQLYKEDAAEIGMTQGDGSNYAYWRVYSDEDIEYNDGVWQDTTKNATADTWQLYETRDYDYTVGQTYDILYWPGGVETVCANDADMVVGAVATNVSRFAGGTNPGDDSWIDNFTIRNYRDSDQPTVSAYGAETEITDFPEAVTLIYTGIWRDSVILNGTSGRVSDVGHHITTRGFDYGMDTTYGSSITETGEWTPHEYSLYIDGLLPNTLYHYRAKVQDDTGAWGYGFDRVFSTDTANILYQYLNEGDDDDGEDIYAGNWEYQTFTTDNCTIKGSSHTVNAVKILAQRVGNPGDLTVSIRKATAEKPKTIVADDLCVGTIDADTFETTPTWQEIAMTPEVTLEMGEEYAIIVRAIAGDNANYVNWRLDTGNGYEFGVQGTSTDNGHSWTPDEDNDHLFEVWGKEALEINSAKVYQSYLEDDDWLITCLYLNEFAPYENYGYDPEEYFYLQIWSDNVTIAQTRCPEWGLKPGQIYLSADQVTSLDWGDTYRVRVYGDFGCHPYREYELQPDDWVGVDLTRLDMWVLNQTSIMETYYDTSLTTYITNKGKVLNDEGAIIWQIGCPMLMQQRGHLFETTISTLSPQDDTWTNSMQTVLNWNTAMGTYLTGAFTGLGGTMNLSGRIVSALFAFLIFALIASLAFGTGHAIAGMACGTPIILAAVFGGSILMVVLGVAVAFAVLLFVWQFIWKGA